MGFDFTNTNERACFEDQFEEAISVFGIDISYWIVEHDNEKEELYAEDCTPIVTEKHDMKAYGDLIQEDFILTKYGLDSSDQIDLTISKKKFVELVGIGTYPKAGDMVYINYMDRIFLVTEAKEEDNIFLQKKFGWKLLLTAADYSGTANSPTLSGDDALPDMEAEPPVFDDNDLIDLLDAEVVVEKIGDTSPWGDFDG